MKVINKKGTAKKVCKHAPTLLIEIDGIGYHCADLGGVIDFKGDFVVNFTRTPNLPPTEYRELAQHFDIKFEYELQVPWPDFDLPRVKMSFWKALHSFIRKQGWKRVCFHCEGGHGRTGTAITAMMIANSGWKAVDALEWVRQNYCIEAVETFEQCDYLEEVDLEYNNRELAETSELLPSCMFDRDDDDKNVIKEYRNWFGSMLVCREMIRGSSDA